MYRVYDVPAMQRAASARCAIEQTPPCFSLFCEFCDANVDQLAEAFIQERLEVAPSRDIARLRDRPINSAPFFFSG
jgi:hypothetical protein